MEIERDMPEVEKHNLDPEFEARRFGMNKEDYQNYAQNVAETHKTIMETMMGKDYERYFNDEGEDVRELAAKAEAERDAAREDEIQAKYYWDAKHGLI